MNPLHFAGTFLIRTNSEVGKTSLERTVSPDHTEGYTCRTGLLEPPQDFLVIRNESIEKDKKVLDWLESQDIGTWSHYNAVMVTAERAKEMLKVFA